MSWVRFCVEGKAVRILCKIVIGELERLLDMFLLLLVRVGGVLKESN